MLLGRDDLVAYAGINAMSFLASGIGLADAGGESFDVIRGAMRQLTPPDTKGRIRVVVDYEMRSQGARSIAQTFDNNTNLIVADLAIEGFKDWFELLRIRLTSRRRDTLRDRRIDPVAGVRDFLFP